MVRYKMNSLKVMGLCALCDQCIYAYVLTNVECISKALLVVANGSEHALCILLFLVC